MCGDADDGARKAGKGRVWSSTHASRTKGPATGKSAGGKRRAQADGKEKGAKPENDYLGYKKKREVKFRQNANTAIHIAMMRPASAMRSTRLLTVDSPLTSAFVE